MQKLVKPLVGVTVERPVSLLELELVPDGVCGVVAVAPHGMERKRFDRQCTLLEGYICLAIGQMPETAGPVKLDELMLPREEDELGKAAVWYSLACRNEDPREVIMAVYNGFGALPGGYPLVQCRAARFLESVPDFLSFVQAARLDEDNLMQPMPETTLLNAPDLNVLRRGLLEACQAERSLH